MSVQVGQDDQFTFVAGLPLREKMLYAAGLFDGEGCLYKKDNKWKLSLTSTDFDIVSNFFDAVLRKGTISGPYQQANRKAYKVWGTVVQDDIYALVAMMYPFLCSRRKTKVEEFIAWYKDYTKGKRK